MDKMPTELVIVCCHAIYAGGSDGNPHDESQWLLKEFQRSNEAKAGEHLTFLDHIKTGSSASGDGMSKVLVFSGGFTDPDHPDMSEASGYLQAARAAGCHLSCRHVLLEELATDSYQNLLFSIVLFKLRQGHYPAKVTVVTHDFKLPRIKTHAEAIGWPLDKLDLIGINPPFAGMLSWCIGHVMPYTPDLCRPRGVR